jgi:hypothetical protein
VRAPIAALTTAHPRSQLHGIANAAKALFSDQRPSLPEWESVCGARPMELSGGGQ